MYFIGVISDNKKFQSFQKFLHKNENKKEYTLININCNSIKNLKNIKFDIVVFMNITPNIGYHCTELKELCCSVKYLLVNSDIDYKEKILEKIEANIITFGLNHLSTVTYSSVAEEKKLITVQRSFKNIDGDIIDVGEYCVNNKENKNYENLVCFIISMIIN